MLKKWAFLLLAAVILASCLPPSNEIEPPAWAYADLRALGAPRPSSPAQDLIALYTRFVQTEFQVRLDLLDSSPDPEADFYLALDTQPGGERRLPIDARAGLEWDALVHLPADGPIELRSPGGQSLPGARLLVTRDPALDTLVVSLESRALFRTPRTVSVQVFTTAAGSRQVADSLGPVRSSDLPPTRVPVLLSFWNSLPAATPAQALRRWNGAHTGPFNARHGLRGVLDAAQATGFPVALLDLIHPQALSSLDLVGGLSQVQELAWQGILLLPEAVPIEAGRFGEGFQPPGWVFSRAASANRGYAQAFGLPASPFLFAPRLDEILRENDYTKDTDDEVASLAAQIPQNYRFLFSLHQASSTENRAQFLFTPFRWQGMQVLSLPEPGDSGGQANPQQVDQDGLSLEVRRALASAAFEGMAGEDGHIFILGGDLSRSAWGDPLAARVGLGYLAAHPWVRPLTGYDLLASHPSRPPAPQETIAEPPAQLQSFISQDALGEPLASGLDTAQIQARVLNALQTAPPGAITEAAWQAYLSLAAPAVPDLPGLAVMRAASLGQVGPLLAAARWGAQGVEAVCSRPADNPCKADLDWDGQEEVILASDRFLGIIETDGAILSYAFLRNGSQVHQLIGPSSQFTVGLSDPTVWKPERGIAGDPNGLPGAFADILAGYAGPEWDRAQVSLSPETVNLTSPDGTLRKTIRLTPNGLSVAYASSQPVRVQIPLVVDPWNRFQPDWADLYQARSESPGWSWGLVPGPRVIIQTSGELTGQAFNAAGAAIKQPEDPNYDYPAGHYLPFPMALAEVRGEGEFTIEIQFIP